jgi:hypothetical protein
MNIQFVIVAAIILAAVIYAGKTLLHKRRAFSGKHGCEQDCGCNAGGKSIRS